MGRYRWHHSRLPGGRWYANNGRVEIFCNSVESLHRLIRQYRHCSGYISERKDGTINARTIS